MTDKFFDGLSSQDRMQLRAAPMPDWIAPMLATLTHDLRVRPGWIYEHKFDGERCMAWRKKGQVRLLSRNRHSLDEAYPEVGAALAFDGPDFILDGEVTAAQGDLSDFQILQKRMQVRDPKKVEALGIKIRYNVFDLLYYDGHDLRALSQRGRKSLLQKVPGLHPPVEIAKTITEWSPEFQKHICKLGWEGLIAKDTHAPYIGKRMRTWLKYKCAMGQAFVIAGYTDPRHSRIGFGALLLGVYDDAGHLHYTGKVGTGFDNAFLRRLSDRMKKLEIPEPAFIDPPKSRAHIHWLRPELVGEVGFSEWTKAGRLRHPRFKGLRDDKAAKDTRREDGQ